MKNGNSADINNTPGENLSDNYRFLLRKYLWPERPLALLLALLILGTIGLQLLNPQIMRQFIDTIAGGIAVGENADGLVSIGFLFLGVALLQQILGVLASYVGTKVSWLTTNRLRADLAEHCLHLDMSFHNDHTPGEMISRIDGDATALLHFFSNFIIRMFSQTLLLVGMLVLLFREDWRVGVALTAFSAVSLFIIWRLKNVAVPYWRQSSQARALLFSFLEERLNGVEDIRTAGAKGYVLNGFYEIMRQLLKIALKATLISNILMNTTTVLFAVGNAIAFIVSAWLFLNNTITIGAVYIIFHYSRMLSGPIQNLAYEAQNLQSAGGSVERIVELLKLESKLSTVGAVGRTTLPTPGPLAVAFENVSFGYEAAKQNGSVNGANGRSSEHPQTSEKAAVLRGLSFHLAPGRTLGLLGRTGSGKTTLSRLLFRLYDPDSGTIRIGRSDNLHNLAHLPLSDLRGQIGLVTQNVELFNASVYDNLTFFDDTVPHEKILDVLRELGLWDWFQSLPDGLDTKISSGGKELSAGQAQLLAFARVFLQDPGLVILDEASSRLDPATEKLIDQAVRRLLRGRTAIIIAHRLSTIQNVDEIMILEGGCLQEYGERAALLNDPNSRFSQLLQSDKINSSANQEPNSTHQALNLLYAEVTL